MALLQTAPRKRMQKAVEKEEQKEKQEIGRNRKTGI